MGVLRPKRRILTFRVTEEEYQHLQRASQIKGARSVADYARSLMIQVMEPDELPERLPQVINRLVELESRVSILAETLRALQS